MYYPPPLTKINPTVYYDFSQGSNDAEDRETVRDLSGNGNDARLYNFGFTGMSGYGGYEVPPFTEWILNEPDRGEAEIVNATTIIARSNALAGNTFAYKTNISAQKPKFRIANLPDEIKMEMGSSTAGWAEVSNGVNILPFVLDNEVLGIRFGTAFEDGDVIVEILPEYPGALVFDGVDDFAEIANSDKCKFKTVFLLLELIDYNSDEEWTFLYDGRPSANVMAAGIHATSVWVQWNDGGKTYINGVHNTKVVTPDMIGKRALVTVMNDRENVDWTAIKRMTTIGSSQTHGSNANIALWKFLGFKEALTEEQIRQVINEYNLLDGVDGIEVS